MNNNKLALLSVVASLLVFAGATLRARAWSFSLAEDADGDDDDCRLSLAETTPDKLPLQPVQGVAVEATHEALLDMINRAKESVRIASFYMELTPQEHQYASHPTAKPGSDVREAIKLAGARGVDIEIILDHSNRRCITNPADVDYLKDVARVKFLNMRRLIGAGILHTKFIIVDNATFYIGSANFDWRAYSHVKEVGLVARDCPVLASDLEKMFNTYSLMADHETMPDSSVLEQFKTKINLQAPLVADGLRVLFAGSPPAFNGAANETGRSHDIDALLHTIRTAEHQIDVSVMNYSPQLEFGRLRYYWPIIDDALREAAVTRHIQVRLLFSRWNHSKALEPMWYKSLNALQSEALEGGGGIHVKLYEVPAYDEWQKALPYARVKHDKYMVTDVGLYLGTSNWTPDYFTNTCGIGVVMEQNGDASATSSKLIQTVRNLFERDFNSEYAHEL